MLPPSRGLLHSVVPGLGGKHQISDHVGTRSAHLFLGRRLARVVLTGKVLLRSSRS